MDFAQELIQEDNTTTKSGIQILAIPRNATVTSEIGEGDLKEPSSHTSSTSHNSLQNHVDELVIQCANKAAADLFLSTGTNVISTMKRKQRKLSNGSASSTFEETSIQEKRLDLVDCKLYPTQLLPTTTKIEPNALVVILESFDVLNFVYATPKAIFNNRNGAFHHDDFIGKNYGCKIRSRDNRGLGFVYLLKPTTELWTRSLNHRTQIVHELDQSMIVFHLNLRPGMVVAESGTGSGAFSHAILRSIAPHGMLHTYEFNHARVKTAREEFERNGLKHMVHVHWRDVCGKSKDANVATSATYTVNSLTGTSKKVNISENSNANEGSEEETIGCGGFNLGQAAAHAIFLDLPEPWLAVPHAAHTIKPNGRVCSYSPCVEQSQRTIEKMKAYGFHSIKTIEARLREHYVDEVALDTVPTIKLPREPNSNPFVPGPSKLTVPVKASSQISDADECTTTETSKSNSSYRNDVEEHQERKNQKRMLCARPFGTMRGHSAFLTFATAGNKRYPDPNCAE